jgi:transcription factor SPN1
MADAEIEDVRKRMTDAARADSAARRENQPAMHKLKMLPEVVSLLNRNQFMNSLVDPEINLLEAVKFFLEPLEDGSLPAYSIQRDLIAALGNLPINKDSLIASGIGKVIVFYTKSKRPEPGIKRQAERLLAEWTRPILQRSDDYSKRIYQEVDFDPTYVLLYVTGDNVVYLTAFSIVNLVPVPRLSPSKLPPPKHGPENSFHHDSPTVRVRKPAIPRTRSFLAPPRSRRASLLVH